ncbi:hypothetical protein JYK00_01145 [Thermosipho ferrireducens]|uniref:Uncharacterized protein n=1 Tax=Thermosipho ferrireducens TaxID=2571116 RepID=A0ABX7S9V8_9BACT|nr:hypothetical protein [Thermosipho ferrireducens]QTA38176.1 hypothetical protein JYK00_01145 [Thermosipho ferrireducens]
MWGIIGGFIAAIFLVEVLDLPEMVAKKLRGKLTNKELEEKVNQLESRVIKLEKMMQIENKEI